MSNKSAFDGDPEGVHPGHSEAAPGFHGGMEALQTDRTATCRVSQRGLITKNEICKFYFRHGYCIVKSV